MINLKFNNKVSNSIFSFIPALLIIFSLILMWEFCVYIFDIEKWLLPSPSAIFLDFIKNPIVFLNHTYVTLIEILIGFILAIIVALLLAPVIVMFKVVERSFYPFLIASQTIPIIVIAPLLLVWIGYGLLPKVIVVALISFFPIVVNTVDGMKSIDRDLLNLLRTMGANKWQIFVKIRVPTCLPFFFSGARVAVTVSVIGAVIGEWVGASEGLGYLMIRSKPLFLTERVFVAIFILSFIGISLFLLLLIIEKLSIPWANNKNNN